MFFVGDAMFWGNDRLDDALGFEALTSTSAGCGERAKLNATFVPFA